VVLYTNLLIENWMVRKAGEEVARYRNDVERCGSVAVLREMIPKIRREEGGKQYFSVILTGLIIFV
jgi:hypothetical protein